MNHLIDLTQSVHQIVTEHPELKELFIDLGFKPLANPLMFNTIAKKTTLIQGAKLIGIPLENLIKQLEWNGYEVIGGNLDE